MEEQNKIYPSIKQTVCLLISLFLVNLLMLVIGRVFLSDIVSKSLLDMCRTVLAGSGILIWAYTKRKRSDEDFTISFKSINGKVWFWTLLTALFYVFFVFGIVALLSVFSYYYITDDTYKFSYAVDICTFINLVCLVPISEELLFRGVILDGFLHRYSPFKAILVSALFFAALHFGIQIVSALFFGIMTGCLYYYTKSVWPGIAMHGINNLFGFLTFCYTNSEAVAEDSIQSPDELIPAIAIWCAVSAIALSFILYHFFLVLKSSYKAGED